MGNLSVIQAYGILLTNIRQAKHNMNTIKSDIIAKTAHIGCPSSTFCKKPIKMHKRKRKEIPTVIKLHIAFVTPPIIL